MAPTELLEATDRLISNIADAEIEYPELGLAHELAQQLREELDSTIDE